MTKEKQENDNSLDIAQYSFKNDYSEGAHQNILNALIETNLKQQDGYGEDDYSQRAIDIIKRKLKNKKADIHFVSGGTQANLIVISSILRPYESVIAANTGHINTHETGAIEATGHKVNTIDTIDGKLTPEGIKAVLDDHPDEHMVKPRLVYISNTTEIGTVYKKKELEELYSFCKAHDLFLFLDGARLGSALCARDNDLSLSELAKLVDVFYIGGTKNGGLLGEAIVINNGELQPYFRFNIKQKGGLLAKGRLLGVQFMELFRDNLYFELAKHANAMAYKISDRLKKLGYEFLTEPASNQIFPILTNELIDELNKKYAFYVWAKVDNDKSAVRLVTSWATKEEVINNFIKDIEVLSVKMG